MVDYIKNITKQSYPLIKDFELSKVYCHIWKNKEITRRQIIKDLRFRPTSVSEYVAKLIDLNLVKESSIDKTGNRGRPKIRLIVNENRYLAISIYTVSNRLEGIIFNMNHKILANISTEVPSSVNNSELLNLFEKMILKLKETAKNKEILGVGISMYGLVNTNNRLLLHSSRWNKIKNADFSSLESKINLPVRIFSSLQAQLSQEVLAKANLAKYGTLLFHWGYGVGACFMIDGKTIYSENGSVLEIGHINYDPNSKKECLCGSTGCIESECSIWALRRLYGNSVPLDEIEFSSFINSADLNKYSEINHSIAVASYALNVLYKIFYPKNIVISSPFFSNEKIKNQFFDIFNKNIPEDFLKNINFSFIESSSHEEKFGSTNELFISKLYSLFATENKL